jgi:preprotein translocase subunit SecD
VAAPVKQRPGRYLGAVALALIALYLGVFLGPASTPALGLDLRGGTEITLTASPLAGGKVTKAALNQAVGIIRSRANGLGVSNASVNTQGSNNIVVEVPGKGRSVLDTIGQTALLRFRQALSLGSGLPAAPTTSPSATPSAKTTHKASTKHKKTKTHAKSSTSPHPKTSKSSQGDAVSSVLEKAKATSTPSPSATTSPSATATPTVSPTPSASASPGSTVGSSGVSTQPLPNSQSPTLTAAFETAYANWNCLKNPNPTEGNDLPTDYIISCLPDGSEKFLLAPAAVEGTQVTAASSGLDQTSAWVVNLKFNGSGASAWQKVTAKAYNVNQGQQSTSCSPPTGCNAVAIVLDGVVQSAPDIITPNGIAGGAAQISGGFTQKTAGDLANILKYGALPLKFVPADVQSVSATLGAAQLRGGLIAGIIGLGLVIIFSLLYYRALGLVTVGSLAVSGLILYAVTTLLGHSSVGYTLSLPGIAGFIVAVGITADSFVVFFERLRDEIREGRRLRSAVDRAWPRARRTIISADFISLLAAVILYVVSIGDVRGFAFTLGLSTLSDLFIVFFFTKPLLMVLARRPAFDSGATWTGIGKARAGVVREPEPDRPTSRRSPRAKEA